jgi:predicted metal-dependent hydrolase
MSGRRFSILATVYAIALRIVQAPMIVVDYLIVHELAHVREPNHSPEFWNLVAVHAPNWSAARGWLKQNGSGLEW